MLVLKRCHRERNMARFYALAIEDTLFGDKALLRNWGRIGTRGREIRQFYPDDADARRAMEEWVRRKRQRGYHIVAPDPAIL